jgi:hypothetical protein
VTALRTPEEKEEIMHRVEMIKQRSIELAESTNLAIVPTDSATATNTTGGRPAK